MLVKILRSFGTAYGSFNPSDEAVEIPNQLAENYIAVGYATPAEPVKVELANTRPTKVRMVRKLGTNLESDE